MKKAISISFIIIGFISLTAFTNLNNEKEIITKTFVKSDYEEGWKDGYCEGWKDVKGQYSICPVTPICPIPDMDCSEGYKCGYNRGFKAGMRAANND